MVYGDIILAVYRYVDIRLSLTEKDSSPYQKNEELKEANKQLEKAYEEKTLAFIRTDDLKMLYIYRYLLAQNNVDLCKRKINCTKYLKRREYYERMIEFFVKDIKAKEMQ